MAEEDTLTKFTMKASVTVHEMMQKIFHNLLRCLGDNFTLHAYGREAVRDVEKVICGLNKWIDVTSIDTRSMFEDCHIAVHFRRHEDIH